MLNRTKRIVYLLYGLLAYLVPMAVLVGIKHDMYFKSKTSTLTISFIIVLALILIVFKKKLFKGTTLSLIIGHIIVLVLLQLPAILADEISLAVSVSMIGLALSAVFERVEDFYKRTSYMPDGTLNRKAIPDRQAWKDAYDFGLKSLKESE